MSWRVDGANKIFNIGNDKSLQERSQDITYEKFAVDYHESKEQKESTKLKLVESDYLSG